MDPSNGRSQQVLKLGVEWHGFIQTMRSQQRQVAPSCLPKHRLVWQSHPVSCIPLF